MATECSWNDGSKAQYYIVILDRLLGRSGGLERALEWRVRGPLIPMSLSRRNQQMNSRRSQLDCMLIYSRIKELIICLLLKRLQLSFLRKVSIMYWIIEMWYYEQEKIDLNASARIVLHMLLFIMFC